MSQEMAKKRADERFRIGKRQQDKLVGLIANMVIRDRLVSPKSMEFILAPDRTDGDPKKRTTADDIGLIYGDDPKPLKIHRHALGQLAGKVEFPIAYLNKLSTGDVWRRDLLVHNLNTLFRQTRFGREENPRFLHRIVGNELRAFLSRRFNRHLASLPLLRAFVEGVEVNAGLPVEATITDLRWSLKCYLPMVFEAFPGQFICVGVTQSHSDFGAAKHVISQSIWDPLRDTRTVLEGVSRVHLGSIIEESDIEMSEGTAIAEVEAQARAAQDAVSTFLGEEAIEKALKAVRLANEESIPWSELRSTLARVLDQKELAAVETVRDNPSIVDLPPMGKTADGEPLPSRWWAASVVSMLANKHEDERKIELQALAGRWLGN